MTEEQIAKHCELQGAVDEKILKERMNIGSELYKFILAKQLTEKDFDILVDVIQIALEHIPKADHLASTLNWIGKYLTLFSMNEENPLVLGEDVLRLLSTRFREQMFSKEL